MDISGIQNELTPRLNVSNVSKMYKNLLTYLLHPHCGHWTLVS
jgi:hypothetical protein